MSAASLADAAARGGAFTIAGQLGRALIQLLALGVLARLLAPADFGLYSMTVAVLGVAAVLGDFGLSMAAIQSQSITHQQRSNLFWTNAAIGGVLMAVAFIAAPAIARFYGEPGIAGIAQALAVMLLINAVSAQFRAELSIKLRFRWLAAADVISVALGFVAALFAAISGLGVWALVAQQLTISGATLVILVAGAHWLPAVPRDWRGMRPLYVFGANTLAVQLLAYATSNIDSILIGKAWGPSVLGVYDRAYQLFKLPLQQVGSPMTKVALPILSRLQSDGRYVAYVLRAQLVLSYAFGGLFLVLAAVADPLVQILLGPGWESAKPILAVLAVGGVFQGIGFVYYWVFLSRALTGLQLRWTIIGRSAMIVAIGLGVFWGALGVAVGSTTGLAVNWLLLTLFPIARTGVPRRALLQIAARPILLLAPICTSLSVLSYVVFKDWNAWTEMLVLLAVLAGYLALAMSITTVRRDVANVWDVVKRVRSR